MAVRPLRLLQELLLRWCMRACSWVLGGRVAQGALLQLQPATCQQGPHAWGSMLPRQQLEQLAAATSAG